MLFAAIQQGERLDWWRSGVFTGLFLGGSFLVLCSLVRRLLGPNPLVALPYLWKWNTVLLGSLLFWFRFTLTGTIILIPQSLAIHGFEADQIGPAIIWSALPLLPVTFIAGLLLLRKAGPSSVAGCRPDLHRFRSLSGRSVHQRMVGGELLSHRAAHWRRTIVFSDRAGGMHHPAGSLHRGPGETSVDPDIFRVLSHHSPIWWNHRRHLHGPLPRRSAKSCTPIFWVCT